MQSRDRPYLVNDVLAVFGFHFQNAIESTYPSQPDIEALPNSLDRDDAGC